MRFQERFDFHVHQKRHGERVDFNDYYWIAATVEAKRNQVTQNGKCYVTRKQLMVLGWAIGRS
jgi:hypothetical protein